MLMFADIKESENLATLHSHIQSCDDILATMETLLTGFQVTSAASSAPSLSCLTLNVLFWPTFHQGDLGNISDEIKYLQDQSSSMSVQLSNRKVFLFTAGNVGSILFQKLSQKLGDFLDNVAVTPQLIKSICESEVNEAYLEYLTSLHKKLDFVKGQPHSIKCIIDVDPELNRLRLKVSDPRVPFHGC